MKLLGRPFVPKGPKKLLFWDDGIDCEPIAEAAFVLGPVAVADRLPEAPGSKPCCRFLGIIMSMLCGPDTSTEAGMGGVLRRLLDPR